MENINEILIGIIKELRMHYGKIDFSNYGIIDANVVSRKLAYQHPMGELFTGTIAVMDPIEFTPKTKYVENMQMVQIYMIRAVFGEDFLDIRSILEVGPVFGS